ncbi:hypothetical protein FQN54_003263 [Arachnomyces sp. PD_36]|nr:hypothetical protein FQN54_003263 [Arachnomyces sp. PD_36]
MGASAGLGFKSSLLVLALLLVFLPTQVHAFGAGNIASISKIEGKNWRHGDIEDMLKTVAFIKGHKWTGMMVKRVYFGNWLRDYSQALDVGTIKSIQADTIRVLVWILAFMTFGYATEEFEVTAERLGVYRPEEHMDNPKDYADNEDARKYDARLRPPIRQIELDIDPETGMKNYIANERGDWATSAGFIKYSISRSIHFGRMYTSGGHSKGKVEDLCEALRCLGQGLHTLEDFGAHTNYCELALREQGYTNVFPHVGSRTQINLRGHHVFPIVTGTFGMVDFFHSMLGEASDHVTQSEVNEMDNALGSAQASSGSSGPLNALTGVLGKVPGTKDLVHEAETLQQRSNAQAYENQHPGHRGMDDQGFHDQSRAAGDPTFAGPPPGPGLPGMPNFDPKKTIAQIYPILQFRDKVVRSVSAIIEKIPGLESLMDKISETVTVFVMSLLAPFIRPIITAASKQLQVGSSGVVDASGKHQYEPWTDPTCTDPTHSLLSKDHFSNVLNEPAGHVASAILQYVAPRILYAWQHIDVPVEQVLADCVGVMHHPAVRDMRNEAHKNMFEAVANWAHSKRGANLNDILSADGVKAGRNHIGGDPHAHGAGHSHAGGHGGHSHGNIPSMSGGLGYGGSHGSHGSHGTQGTHGGHGQQQHQGSSSSSIPWDKLSSLPIPGASNLGKLSHFIPSGSSREMPDGGEPLDQQQQQQGGQQSSYYDQQQQQGGQYQQYPDQQQQQQQYDSSFNFPAPSGYEHYSQAAPAAGAEGQWPQYQPPAHGAHTYDYHTGTYGQQQPPYGGGGGYGY